MESRDPRLVEIGVAADRPQLKIRYRKAAELVGPSSAHPLRRSLCGIAVGPRDRIHVLGDDEVRVFSAETGELLGRWPAPPESLCLAVDSEEWVWMGRSGRVDAFDGAGKAMGGFPVAPAGKPATVTSVKAYGKEILVADASARHIRRYDRLGRPLGEIGTRNKTRGFMLPNRWLDIAVDPSGVIRATDTGRHQVTAWKLDGEPAGRFGKFGLQSPGDFVGCCNPVNVAAAPGGRIVTAEKVAARVKIYDSEGNLLGLIGPEHFDPRCVHIPLAVDSKARILAGDPVRLGVSIFEQE